MLSLNVPHPEPDHHRAARPAGRAPRQFQPSRAARWSAGARSRPFRSSSRSG